MKKEILIFFCETENVGRQHEEILEYTKEGLYRAEQMFRMWTNCYLVKVRTTDENDMYFDEILYKRNIIL